MKNRLRLPGLRPHRFARIRVSAVSGALLFGLLSLAPVPWPPAPAAALEVRIKDVARIQGVRENELFGYGLVIGLNGTGDRDGTIFTAQSIANMLQRLNVTVPRAQLRVKNVAAVVVTAKIPPYAKQGGTVDVLVSSLGDATSLFGGTLLITPLQAADGKVYAVAQGPLILGGFSMQAGGGADKQTKNHPTVGRIPGGATIEQEVPLPVIQNQTLAITLKNPDFTTAGRMAEAINRALGTDRARAEDPATVRLPLEPGKDVIQLVSSLENLRITPDQVAKVVINERTGTIIMGNQVRISTVAIAHGNLSVSVSTDYQVSQPAPFANRGRTVVTPDTNLAVQEQKSRLSLVEEGVSIGDLVRALNALGVTSRDLIDILQAIRQAGALQADLEVL
jgi:flagellar P-ring protein precursor FlgI